MEPSLREELTEAVDDVWAESVRLLPMADGSADGSRAVVEITGVLRTGDRRAGQSRRGGRDVGTPHLASDGGTLRIDRTAWPAVQMRKHDKIVALDRPGLPVFEVLAVDDRSHLRLILHLGDAN